MNEKARKRRDFIQNITIAVLSVSAVLLFAQTQISNLGSSSAFSRFFSGPDAVQADSATAQQDSESPRAPVRVAVSNSYGRYGNIMLTTANDDFEPLRALLAQALGSAQALTLSSEKAFLAALSGASVYYDFLSPLPLSLLADLSQTTTDEAVSARRLVISGESGGVFLYLWDDDSHCYRCGTALSAEDLEETVGQYELGNAFFAFESADSNAQASAPYSLLLEETPSLPVLSVEIPLSDTSQLLASLHFNPNTQNRYQESDGTEVISETGGRTLRIQTNGTVTYQGGNDPTLSIEAAGEIPSLTEVVSETGTLLRSLLSSDGDEELYLESIQQTGTATTLRFGYQVGGVPVRFADGFSAAQVTLSGTAVSSITFRIRQYTVTEENSLLLPIRQTLAIAAGQPGAELFIGYADTGGNSVTAAWLAD